MAAIYLEKPPEEVYKYLLKIQGEAKSAKGIAVYSLAQTVYQIIREHEAGNKTPTQFELLNTNFLLYMGWERFDGTSYKKGNDVIKYSGTEWFINGEKLTEQNYLEKIK